MSSMKHRLEDFVEPHLVLDTTTLVLDDPAMVPAIARLAGWQDVPGDEDWRYRRQDGAIVTCRIDCRDDDRLTVSLTVADDAADFAAALDALRQRPAGLPVTAAHGMIPRSPARRLIERLLAR